jgi:hypothetical protein
MKGVSKENTKNKILEPQMGRRGCRKFFIAS